MGDINPDNFTSDVRTIEGPGFASEFRFIALTQDGSGFIAVGTNSTYPGGPFYYLFQNSYTYNQFANDAVTASTTPNETYAICFTTGTRIATPRGAVPIEALAVGDEAVTASGERRTITWIGRRTLDCRGEAAHMAPVRIRANAFGAGIPERDVHLSPGHPVLVRHSGVEALVPVMNLINGTTIERSARETVTYWHVELDRHDVLLADGLPAESFFDMGSRGWFENDLDDVLANPDLVPPGQHGRCRDVAVEGPLVEAERRRISELFYADLSAQCAWPVHESHGAL
ncbi:Hint domain-containing protein [Aurantimonas sp. 22II-16-19i]|uniref:Hint domain-containing protein n=1 Tax=Aurantimonas sp. 22II-16-19i TaxID=1317114 RepID=UPI0009F7AF21|nr:Hint domain-containing protein [Aurantimonas sp. 22II-16-19i]ORE93880.1 hypothetical protein ATO4_14961 [Aurantimonas sp. 22II-16-19i]